MRYYCESNPQTINHVTPSVLMLDQKIQLSKETDRYTKTILDLGCGNGRNSLYLAKKYSSANVVLVDSDISMLNWAQHLFSLQEIKANSNFICTTIEELASDSTRLYNKTGISSFDIVIFSYVVQHIDPVYYPLIFDFCKQISKRYMAIDVFWNPSRIGAGEYTKIGSVNWYGLTYEELVSIIATRFHILNDRIYKTDISFVINLLLTEGQTPFEDILWRSYEFSSNRIRRRRQQSDFRFLATTKKNRAKLIDINELECIRLLSSLYPTELDFIKTEFTQWMEASYRVMTPALMAAKFLWLCRINKLPVTLNEISRDFGVRTKNIIHTLSNTDYIPPLSTSDYINRISMQLSLPSKIVDHALYLDKKHVNLNNTGPVMRACCAVIRAADTLGFTLSKQEIASMLGLTSVGVRLALKRLE